MRSTLGRPNGRPPTGSYIWSLGPPRCYSPSLQSASSFRNRTDFSPDRPIRLGQRTALLLSASEALFRFCAAPMGLGDLFSISSGWCAFGPGTAARLAGLAPVVMLPLQRLWSNDKAIADGAAGFLLRCSKAERDSFPRVHPGGNCAKFQFKQHQRGSASWTTPPIPVTCIDPYTILLRWSLVQYSFAAELLHPTLPIPFLSLLTRLRFNMALEIRPLAVRRPFNCSNRDSTGNLATVSWRSLKEKCIVVLPVERPCTVGTNGAKETPSENCLE